MKPNYPANWPEIALACKEAADWTCQICGRPSAPGVTNGSAMLAVSHVDHDTENPDARLVVMCSLCHIKWDRGLHLIVIRHKQRRRRRLELGREKKGLRK